MTCHHGTEPCEEHEGSMGKIVCLIFSAGLLIVAMLALHGLPQILVYAAAYLLAGWCVLWEAVENIIHGVLFDENFLMSIASMGAFCIGEYPEAAAVMLLYTVGELLQDRAVDSSRDAISALVDIRSDRALRIANGETCEVSGREIAVGEHILVRPGERVPLDGIICSGSASVDTSPLTGEALPRLWEIGDSALAGCVCCDGTLEIEVTKPFEQSSVSRILSLIEEAQENKAKPERFITRFSKIYTPVVCMAAFAVAVIPPLLHMGSWRLFLHKALAFLVISCPCALVISVPLSFFAGIGCASHHGILMKGGNYLETLAKTEIAAFDKTGTLTAGDFRLEGIYPAEHMTEQQLLEIAAYCESRSAHPLAKSVCRAYHGAIVPERICNIREKAGYGVSAVLDGKTALVGSDRMMGKLLSGETAPAGTVIHVAYNGVYCGYLALTDAPKPDAEESIATLRELGVHDLTVLSGDRQAVQIGEALQMDQTFAQLLPEDKVTHLQRLKQKGTLLYAGDGINDAPVLAAADVGIAMGGLGSDAAMEAADVVIMDDTLNKIPLAIRIARKTMRIARENIVFSIAVKLLILALSLATTMELWLAVFADVGVCMLAILNALRVLRI